MLKKINIIRFQNQEKILSFLNNYFSNPFFSFDLYFSEKYVTRKEVMNLHFYLWLIAPLSKILNNIFCYCYNLITFKTNFSLHLMDGVFVSLIMYPVIFVIIIQLDYFRIYYKKTDRTKNEYLEREDLSLLSFIPFSASSVFWIFPAPLHYLGLTCAFVYSLWIFFESLMKYSQYSIEQIIRFILMLCIYFLIPTTGFLIIYNIYRTVFR